jgi:hypothetical protein
MIISASRRTDIPAFFGEWFMDRIREKKVLVKNPRNPSVVSEISLNPEQVQCIVFWTKNAKNFIQHLGEIERAGHRYYFQYTLNSYGNDIEKNLDAKSAMEAFIALSKLIGKEKVICRYDPLIINDKYTVEYHVKKFKELCEKLGGFTEKCVISFIDSYRFLSNAFKDNNITELTDVQIQELSGSLSSTAKEYGIPLSTCCERIDLSPYNIARNKCVDDELINKLFGLNIAYKKDPGQRRECGCYVSRDIGAYNTCQHGCVYCYARRVTGPTP